MGVMAQMSGGGKKNKLMPAIQAIDTQISQGNPSVTYSNVVMAKECLMNDNTEYIVKKHIVTKDGVRELSANVATTPANYMYFWRDGGNAQEATFKSLCTHCFTCFIDDENYISPVWYGTADAPKIFKYSLLNTTPTEIVLSGTNIPTQASTNVSFFDTVKFNNNLYAVTVDSSYCYVYKINLSNNTIVLVEKITQSFNLGGRITVEAPFVLNEKCYINFSDGGGTFFRLIIDENENINLVVFSNKTVAGGNLFDLYFYENPLRNFDYTTRQYIMWGSECFFKGNGDLYKISVTGADFVRYYKAHIDENSSIVVDSNPCKAFDASRFNDKANTLCYFLDNYAYVENGVETFIRYYDMVQ